MSQDLMYVQMRRRTREALKNLFYILRVEGRDFDEQLFELASRAFAGRSVPHESLRRRSKGGTKPRKQIEVKMETIEYMEYIHSRMFPYLPWQSWDWFLNEMAKAVEATLHEKKEEFQLHEDE